MSERDELVAQLRGLYRESWPSVRDAADQIERDGREIERLVAALEDIYQGEPDWPDQPQKELDWCRNRARAALNGEGET